MQSISFKSQYPKYDHDISMEDNLMNYFISRYEGTVMHRYMYEDVIHTVYAITSHWGYKVTYLHITLEPSVIGVNCICEPS